MTGQLDLVVLVADIDAEVAVRTLLSKRTVALGIRPIELRMVHEPGHDPAVFRRAPDLLHPYLDTDCRALVMLDREGSGQEGRLLAAEMEAELETCLARAGWGDLAAAPRAVAVVLDPELEVWVWSPSPHVAEVLGMTPSELALFLQDLPKQAHGKPERPKEALELALQRSRKPRSPSVFRDLARSVSLRTGDRAFAKFRTTLQTWFPVKTPASRQRG